MEIDKNKIFNELLASRIELYDKEFLKKYLKKILLNRSISESIGGYKILCEEINVCVCIDNNVVKKIYENKELNNIDIIYLTNMDKQMILDPYLFFAVPLSNLSYDILISYKKYMPNIETIILNAQEILKRAKEINNKIGNNLLVSSTSKKDLYKFLGYYINYNRVKDNFNYELLVKKLLNKRRLSYDEIKFLMKYLGYVKCYKEKLINTEIILGNCDEYIEQDNQRVTGIHLIGVIILNKRHMIGMSFKKSSKINDEVFSGLENIETLYHELAHAEQYRDFYEHNDNYREYLYSIDLIDSQKINNNYFHSENEIDAEISAKKDMKNFLKKYIPKSKEINNINNILKSINYKFAYDYKINIDGEDEAKGKYEKRLIDNYFKENPKMLNTFPILEKFYHKSGKPYRLVTLFLKNSFKNKEYYYSYILGKACSEEKISIEDLMNTSDDDKIQIINNIYIFLKYINLRLIVEKKLIFTNDISDYKKIIKYNMLIDIEFAKFLICWYNLIINHYPNIVKENMKLIGEVNNIIEKFNISNTDVLNTINRIKKEKNSDCLKLL